MQQHCRAFCLVGALFLAGLAFTSPGAASPRPPAARHGSANAGPAAMEAPEDAAPASAWQLGAGLVLGFMVALSAAAPAQAGLMDQYGKTDYDKEKARVGDVKYAINRGGGQPNREKVLEGDRFDTPKSSYVPPVKK